MKQALLSGRYELEEIVGTGGMSVVYRAWDMKYDREVAVKVLRPEYVADESFVHQFNHEAKATSKMSHPNIVTMYDIGQDGETRYIVMEFIRGATLKDVIRQNEKLRPQKAVQMTLKILQAIDHAHKNGIVHRDIKPQNILVDGEGRVKVTDFGIARVLDSTSATSSSSNILGSVHYFSPEQAKGAVADVKSDLYSVGVVFYEMVTGRVPFDGETPMAVALKHINETPQPASNFNAEVSKGLDEVIAKALEKDPVRRYQTALEMATDFKRALKMPMGGFICRTPEEAAREAALNKKKRRRRAAKWAAVGAAALLLALGGLKMWNYYEKLQTRIRVPSFEMNDAEDAKARLDAMGLEADIVGEFDNQIVSGLVISQQPDNGALVFPGDTVRLTVSLGREFADVPYVCGLPRSEAVQQLENAGMTVGAIELEISDDVPVGDVIRQEPEAGAQVEPFSEATLYVSGECSVVPSLDGLTVELARSTLAASGLQLGETIPVDSDAEPGTVIGQSIETGERVLWGVTVDITVSATDTMLFFDSRSVSIDVKEAGTVVYAILSDGETEREIYRHTFGVGTQTISLNLSSDKPGEQTLKVYAGDRLAMESGVVFGE